MYKRGSKGWAKHLDFIILDCICLGISFFLAYIIRHGWNNPLRSSLYREFFLISISINFIVILLLDTMKNVLKRGYLKEFSATIWQVLVLLFVITTYLFSTKSGEDYSRITVYSMVLLYSCITYSTRILWKKMLRSRKKSKCDNALLLITSEKKANVLIEQISTNNFKNHKIVGIVVDDYMKIGERIDGIEIVATKDTVVEYVKKHWVDEVLIVDQKNSEITKKIVDDLISMGVTVHLGFAKSDNRIGTRQVAGNIGGLFVISFSMNYMSPRQYFIKRGMDILGGLTGCFITGVLYLILAPLIKKESPGPVFFSQERIGKNGKPFKIYKFRSMYRDAEERKAELMAQNRLNNNLMFKMDFDPRVIGNRIDENGNQRTGIGEFIRKYSLDEFPQFFNVLKGEMSMIGDGDIIGTTKKYPDFMGCSVFA